jgi:hypothetical protein
MTTTIEFNPSLSIDLSAVKFTDTQNKCVEILESQTQLDGEDILPGFILDLTTIW